MPLFLLQKVMCTMDTYAIGRYSNEHIWFGLSVIVGWTNLSFCTTQIRIAVGATELYELFKKTDCDDFRIRQPLFSTEQNNL